MILSVTYSSAPYAPASNPSRVGPSSLWNHCYPSHMEDTELPSTRNIIVKLDRYVLGVYINVMKKQDRDLSDVLSKVCQSCVKEFKGKVGMMANRRGMLRGRT